MESVKACSITEFINIILNLSPYFDEQRGNTLEREELVFRGLSSSAYDLKPAIVSRTYESWYNNLLYFEDVLISRAQQKIPDFLQQDMLPISKLAKLQHYGIPTRLMDVTSNPLVALYFACRDTHNTESADGEVIVFSSICFPASNPYIKCYC